MKNLIKTNIKNIMGLMGMDIKSIKHKFENRFVNFIDQMNLQLVVDVGANVGQFAEAILNTGYKGKIISFEPQPDLVELMYKKATAYDGRWIIAPAMALSDRSGTATFQRMAAHAMSSLNMPADSMNASIPSAQIYSQYEVELARIDEILWNLPDIDRQPFALKMDTQGSELNILNGADKIWKDIKLIQLETSIKQLYDNQPPYYKIDEFLRQKDFHLADMENGYSDAKDGSLVEFDAVYRKNI